MSALPYSLPSRLCFNAGVTLVVSGSVVIFDSLIFLNKVSLCSKHPKTVSQHTVVKIKSKKPNNRMYFQGRDASVDGALGQQEVVQSGGVGCA